MKNPYCRYCWPTKRRFHVMQHVEFFVEIIISLLCRPLKIISRLFGDLFFEDAFFDNIGFDLLHALGIIEFVQNPDEKQLHNRSLIFFKEAKKRRIPIRAIKIFGRYTKDFQVIINNKKYYYEGIPLTMRRCPRIDVDNKNDVKKLLQENNIPVAPGRCFVLTGSAIKFAKSIGYPVVVKPNTGSLSYHTTCNIADMRSLRKAIGVAKRFRPDFIVERFIEGELYRATVIGKKHVFVCQKERANIVGDGVSTVLRLIKEKNKNALRGDLHQKNTTLHKIPVDDTLKKRLKTEFLRLDSIPSKNRKVYLQDKYILSYGCDIINCTELVHPHNKALFLAIARLLDIDVVGIDFICPDIRKSHEKQTTAVLETNSLPYIDMHQYPSSGKPDDVARIGWNFVLGKR